MSDTTETPKSDEIGDMTWVVVFLKTAAQLAAQQMYECRRRQDWGKCEYYRGQQKAFDGASEYVRKRIKRPHPTERTQMTERRATNPDDRTTRRPMSDQGAKSELDALRDEVKGIRKALMLMCVEWAEDHTYAQTVAKRLGVPSEKVDGDSYGAPGISGLIDMIMERVPANKETEQ